MKKYIEIAKRKALAGERQDRETILALLSIPEYSDLCNELGAAAREVAGVITQNRAYLWGAIGVDSTPCEMNCDYCSLGEKWQLIREKEVLEEEEVFRLVREYVENGVRWIVLRTTEFYSVPALGKLIGQVRKEVPGNYEIGLNVGEMNETLTHQVAAAGASFAYHALRLGEGRDTRFDPKTRTKTLNVIGKSTLDLVYLVEPVGREHSNEEIADIMESALSCGASVSGAMARIPVKGTPFGAIPQVSDRRMAQIIAVSRLVCGQRIPDICVHPYSDLAAAWGANVTVVERGVIPRDIGKSENVWNGFSCKDAIEGFRRNGYTVYQTRGEEGK